MSDTSSHKPASSVRQEPPASGVEGGRSSSARHVLGADGQRTVISSRPPVPSLDLGHGAPPLELGNLQEGDQLGQFVLQKFIGGGGMGIVFRALDTTLNREVAVKVLSRDQAADEEALRRFRNEAQSAARLNHDNIARVHYVGEDRGVHYIVFEYIEGTNIRDLVEQHGPLPLQQAVSYTYQIAQALEHASQRAVIHRDIKPSNVLITSDGKAKLVDMGLARLNQVAHTDDLTASGVTLGTFDYISPEQARDPRSADVRSDLYSLGCSFFYMLTGRPPFPDGTVLQKLLQHQADSPPDPRTLRPELPAEVARILTRLLAKNPAQRHQRPEELLEDLSALGDRLGMQLSSPRTVWAPPPVERPLARWQRHAPWAVPLAALFLIVIVLDSTVWSPTVRVDAPNPALAASKSAAKRGASSSPPAPLDPTRSQTQERHSSQKVVVPPPDVAPSSPFDVADAPVGSDNESENPNTVGDQTGPLLNKLRTTLQDNLNVESLAARLASAAKAASQLPSDKPTAHGVGPASTAGGTFGDPRNTASQPSGRRLVVSDAPGGENTYSSLQAACTNAKNGDVIELCFNGRRSEKPVTISNVKLTITAGDHFAPVVVFRPSANDPIEYPPSMLSVSGGQLSASRIHWELDLPRNAPSDWALFEARHAELLQFENCTFTIRGQASYHAGACFFDIKASPSAATMGADVAAMDDQILTINLVHCVARGEATLVRDNDLQPFKLDWNNGLLATGQRLLSVAGGPSQPRQLGHIQLSLRHVTVNVTEGLALMANGEDAPYQLLTEIHGDDSIFLSRTKPPLIEQRGSDQVDQYLARLQWSGNRDFFDGFDVFWRISNDAAQSGSREMRFEDWQNFWRQQSRGQSAGRNAVHWTRLPSVDVPMHAHTPAEYALDATAANNAALGGASDGLDAGCIAAQLPELPSDIEDEPTSTGRPTLAPSSRSDGS